MTINADTVTMVLVLLLTLERILRRLAPLTTWAGDDKAVEQIDKAKEWVGRYAPLVWGIVEDLAAVKAIAKGEKSDAFVTRLSDAWQKMNPGKSLPIEAAHAASLIAEGMSKADHLDRPLPIEAPPADPQAAPLSR